MGSRARHVSGVLQGDWSLLPTCLPPGLLAPGSRMVPCALSQFLQLQAGRPRGKVCQPAQQLAVGQSVLGTCILTGSATLSEGTLGEELTHAKIGLSSPRVSMSLWETFAFPLPGVPRTHSLQFRGQ